MSEHDTALRAALAAYGGATSGEHLDARLVRARVLQSARAPRQRSLRRVSLVLPLVATFAASAAFAASQPQLRAALATHWQSLRAALPSTPKEAPARPRPRRTEVAAPGSRAPDQALSSSLPPPAPIAIDELPLDTPAAAPDSARLDDPSKAASVSTEADRELEAYRGAHRIHFDQRHPSAGLAAWDDYLAEFPHGSFAADARFNRALCLIRLGRLVEARVALVPFAGGVPGSYRQAEAAALVQGLSMSRSGR